jgi:phage tail sheath protein FI
MPEYLAPGVYVEEVSFRAKTIEGVGTSTAGFIGPTRFGPVFGPPPLLTGFLDFERIYGGLDQLQLGGSLVDNHLAHAVRGFFENGGARLYVARAFSGLDPDDRWLHHASSPLGSTPDVVLRARHPGRAGNFRVAFDVRVGPNIFDASGDIGLLRGALGGDTVLVVNGTSPLDVELRWLQPTFDEDNGFDTFRLLRAGTTPELVTGLADTVQVRVVTVNVTVGALGRFVSDQFWEGLGLHPSVNPSDRRGITTVFAETPVNRSAALTVPLVVDTDLTSGVAILEALLEPVVAADASSDPPGDAAELLWRYAVAEPPAPVRPVVLERRLEGGSDGDQPDVAAYEGDTAGDGTKSGLLAFEDLDDISIVAAPGSSAAEIVGPPEVTATVQQLLISHCERMRYRIGVLDSGRGELVADVLARRGVIDSKYAALYYPWVTILDPVTEREINTPPSGFVAGVYARNDIEQGVHKSPANEVVRLAIDFELRLNKAQQDVLNPEGVNCLRFFEGRGFRVWGARTISSDPEWKYVAVRRYFAYLEHSIDKGTQWAVFEPNGRILWESVRRTVNDFLYNEWKSNRLLGAKPEEAFFVRCDLSTMTQNDLDNGRLIVLVGVAPLRPAEFVIFRIGQMTLDSRI